MHKQEQMCKQGNRQVATHGKMHVIANSQGGIFLMGTNFQAKAQTRSNS
jgi:hypothetical protein